MFSDRVRKKAVFIWIRGVGTGPAGPVSAGPLFQGKKIISFL